MSNTGSAYWHSKLTKRIKPYSFFKPDFIVMFLLILIAILSVLNLVKNFMGVA